MDDNRTTGVRFFAFILVALALTEIGWATQVDGNPLVGALTGLAVAVFVAAFCMFLGTVD